MNRETKRKYKKLGYPEISIFKNLAGNNCKMIVIWDQKFQPCLVIAEEIKGEYQAIMQISALEMIEKIAKLSIDSLNQVYKLMEKTSTLNE